MATTGVNFQQHVFLHGGWRCGSTYIWNKFRALPGVVAFYEPFNEKLAKCTAGQIDKDTETTWGSRHPALEAPYWAEYLPLITNAGVLRYEDRFALQRFFVSSHDELEESGYLRLLLAHAQNAHSQAVLGFSRSLGRVGSIKRTFGGNHVVLMRDPVQQWLSSRSYRLEGETSYFELCHLMILALAPADSLAGRTAKWLQLPRLPAGAFGRQYRFIQSHFRRLEDELSYKAFIALYILAYLEALPEADLVIDMDLLSRSNQYGRSVTIALFERTGLMADFGDCSLPVHDPGCTRLDFERLHDSVSEWLLMNELESAGGTDNTARTSSRSAIMNKLGSAQRPAVLPHAPADSRAAPNEAFHHSTGETGSRLRRLFGV